jgi:hypothetical protein
MGKVRTGHATSLDGFIAGPNDGPEAPMGKGGERLLAWYMGGDTEYGLPLFLPIRFRKSGFTKDRLSPSSGTASKAL